LKLVVFNLLISKLLTAGIDLVEDKPLTEAWHCILIYTASCASRLKSVIELLFLQGETLTQDIIR
jgi:hypothetical protein